MSAAQPLRTADEVGRVLAGISHPRDRCLFVLGVNTAFRGSDLLGLRICDVENLKVGDTLTVREKKTGKSRFARINEKCVSELINHIAHRKCFGASPEDALFTSKRSDSPLTIIDLSRLWKEWGLRAGIDGLGSHTGRKTKATLLRKQGVDIAVISKFLNHSDVRVTMGYLGVNSEEVDACFMKEV